MNKTQIFILLAIAAIIWMGFMADQLLDTPVARELVLNAENAAKHGEVKQYTSDGRLKTIVNYDNGIKHGYSYLYHSDGKTVLLAMPYHQGKRSGISKKYYESGELYAETPYENDELHGIRQVYYRSGKLKSEAAYWNGLSGVGAMEYLTNGEVKEPFLITYKQEANHLFFNTNKPCKNTRFYLGKLIADKFLDPMSEDIQIMMEKDQRYYIDLRVFTPSYLKYQDIICECTSTQGNSIILRTNVSDEVTAYP